MKTYEFKITGMTCEHCAVAISKSLDVKGVTDKNVSYSQGNAVVSFDEDIMDDVKIQRYIEKSNQYKVTGSKQVPHGADKKHLVIIGGGSSAFAATIAARERGIEVTMINAGLPIGGTCVNVGCVPSKTLIRAAETVFKANNNPFNGINSSAKVDNFEAIMRDKEDLVLDLREQKYIDIIKDMPGFRFIKGRASLINSSSVKVNDEMIHATHIIIATGSKSMIPNIKGLKDVDYLTNIEAFELKTLPSSMIIIGGSYIALEIAQMFSRLGSRVTILERSSYILSKQHKDIADELSKYLVQEGINIVTNNDIQEVCKKDNKITITTLVDKKQKLYKADKLIVATGRQANTQDMNLEQIGVRLNKNDSIQINKYLQTSIDNIYAIGDVTGQNMFVYTAAYEGKLAVSNAFDGIKTVADYDVLPWVIFTDPQVAGVGLDEIQAKQKNIDYETALLPLSYIPRAIAARDTRGFIKLLKNKADDRLIGARIVAPEGSELLMQISQAIKFGITISELKDMLYPYLTMSEGIKLAAITFSKNVKELSCCAT